MKIVSVKALRDFTSTMVGNIKKDDVVNVSEAVAKQLEGAGIVKKVKPSKASKSAK